MIPKPRLQLSALFSIFSQRRNFQSSCFQLKTSFLTAHSYFPAPTSLLQLPPTLKSQCAQTSSPQSCVPCCPVHAAWHTLYRRKWRWTGVSCNTVPQKCVSHIHNSDFSTSHIKKQKETDEINFNNMDYVTVYPQCYHFSIHEYKNY